MKRERNHHTKKNSSRPTANVVAANMSLVDSWPGRTVIEDATKLTQTARIPNPVASPFKSLKIVFDTSVSRVRVVDSTNTLPWYFCSGCIIKPSLRKRAAVKFYVVRGRMISMTKQFQKERPVLFTGGFLLLANRRGWHWVCNIGLANKEAAILTAATKVGTKRKTNF